MVLSTYLIRTAIAGGLFGGVHGLITLDHSNPDNWGRAAHVAYHTQAGAILGPWFPIAFPLWFQLDSSTTKTACPFMKGETQLLKPVGPEAQKQEIPPTVAEKP